MANRKRKAQDHILTFRADRRLVDQVKAAVKRDKNMDVNTRQAVEVALREYLNMIVRKEERG